VAKVLDFIIVDVLLGEAGGFEICSSLRVNPATKDIPLLVITSRPDEKNIEQASQLGIHHFLPKPFTEDELLQEIFALLMDRSRKDS
jgi:chemosensory pili system protein ChpA (sensor histidine kinase/response regulator)